MQFIPYRTSKHLTVVVVNKFLSPDQQRVKGQRGNYVWYDNYSESNFSTGYRICFVAQVINTVCVSYVK